MENEIKEKRKGKGWLITSIVMTSIALVLLIPTISLFFEARHVLSEPSLAATIILPILMLGGFIVFEIASGLFAILATIFSARDLKSKKSAFTIIKLCLAILALVTVITFAVFAITGFLL